MNNKLTPMEWECFNKIMEQTLQNMSNAGCNDFDLPNTPEGMALGKAFAAEIDGPEYAAQFERSYSGKKTVIVNDMDVLQHLIKKLKA